MAYKILQCFKQFDTNQDGYVEGEELASILLKLAPDKFDEDRAREIIDAADVDGDGRLNYEEFVAWLYKSSSTDFREAVKIETWECFPNLKAGFDANADDYGYVHLENVAALRDLARYLGLDTAVVGKEMEEADCDSNGFVGFAEFALWADKNTVGIDLGLKNVPDKRKWWEGMPSYWTSIEVPEEVAEDVKTPKAAVAVAAAFKPVPEDDDTSELEDFIQAAKRFHWKQACNILERHPGYIDMRPHYRFYGAIHHAAYQGDADILHMLVTLHGANPALPNKGGQKPREIAAERGKHLAAEYLEQAEAKMSGGPAAKPAGRTRRGGGAGGKSKKQMMAAANEIVEKAKWKDWSAMFEMLEAWPECVNIRPPFRNYGTIHQAAYNGNVDVLRRLIDDCQADPNLKTKHGQTPLEVAESVKKNEEAIEYLSSLSGRPPDYTGIAHHMITLARDARWHDMFNLLKETPGAINIRPEVRAYGAIHQAAHHGDVKVLREMVEDYKADVKLLTKDGKTAQQVAEEEGHEEAAAFLQACSPMIRLEDDFVTFPDQKFVKVEDEATLAKLAALCRLTHKTHHNWSRDRKRASGFDDPHTPVPKGYEFVGAHRNEHPALWRIYQTSREVVRQDCSDPKKPPMERWLPWTMEHDELKWNMYDVSDEANEWMLLHASVPPAVRAICRSGFSMKCLGLGAVGDSKSKLGLYGNGSYFTDSITKADEYARGRCEDDDEFAGCRTLLIVRVVGGRHWYTDKEVKEEDKPEFAKRVLMGHYTSTVGDRFALKNTFREIVAYDASGTYPEYIVYYRRQGVPPEHV
mmetsp:Transcript_42979/g.79918  ORF Transcript_42979/g.79918 Transcript_42979/m.79918 type:complete len:809 (-) Transcript_42979:72-2498(-)